MLAKRNKNKDYLCECLILREDELEHFHHCHRKVMD